MYDTLFIHLFISILFISPSNQQVAMGRQAVLSKPIAAAERTTCDEPGALSRQKIVEWMSKIKEQTKNSSQFQWKHKH